MDKIAIIGSGFTSYILYKKLEKYKPIVISPKRILKDTLPFNRHKKFEVNKLNSKKAFSFNNQIFKLNNSCLHDRLIDGGHSNIWGGFCNTENFNKKIFIFLKKSRILLSKLNFYKNGCHSNIPTIVQLNDSKRNIFSSQKRIKKYIDGFVFNFENKKDCIKLKILINKNKCQYIYKSFKKVFIAISISQLISLLKNSNIIKVNDLITLEEYQYNHSLKFFNTMSPLPPPHFFLDHNDNINKVEIIFNLFGIIKHFFNLKIKRFFNFFPFVYLVQKFQYKKNICKIKNIKKNIFKEIYAKKNFGKSIHVNYLKINKKPIKSLYNKKIEIFGPAAIQQKKPGPISNDIIIDVFKRIN